MRFLQPCPGAFDVGRRKVLDGRPRKGLTEPGHPGFPSLIADQGDALEVRVVFDAKLEIIPGGVQIPAVKVLELGE
jgi:hypothetical protein